MSLRAWIDKLLGRSKPQPPPAPDVPHTSPRHGPLTEEEQAEREEREAPREGPLPPYEI